jgi:hypothetical protein
MGILDRIYDNRIDEALKAFINKGLVKPKDEGGEGMEDVQALGYTHLGLSSFNKFYSTQINKFFESEREKIKAYRRMADMPEIADCIEDATNESTQENDDGDILELRIIDQDMSDNENISKILYNEFNDLFYNRIKIQDKLWDFFRSYLIDGRLYYERIINENHPSDGIKGIKKLPSETMDFEYDISTGNITCYYQFLSEKPKKPSSKEQAKLDKNVIVFEPEQIGFVNYGQFGPTKHQIFGYLEKAKVPYNQLKLLETSVIIYRIVRSPERLVFKIDTGNMPRDKAMKFVEKIKDKFLRKQTYDPSTGSLTREPEVLSILENFYLPQSGDGRGSSIESVGGDSKGFTELDDIYYFARKLYRSLKYPLSRVSASQEHRESETIFGGSRAGEISRDEIKWARFLERQQNKFCDEFLNLFLLHLNFKGLKKNYSLDRSKIKVVMNDPSYYKDSQEQSFLEQRFSNYNALSSNPEFPKTYLMKKYLGLTDEDLQEIKDGFADDKKIFPSGNDDAQDWAEMGMGMGR